MFRMEYLESYNNQELTTLVNSFLYEMNERIAKVIEIKYVEDKNKYGDIIKTAIILYETHI